MNYWPIRKALAGAEDVLAGMIPLHDAVWVAAVLGRQARVYAEAGAAVGAWAAAAQLAQLTGSEPDVAAESAAFCRASEALREAWDALVEEELPERLEAAVSA